MSKIPLDTMKELNDDFLEWFNETAIEYKDEYSNPTEMKKFFVNTDEGNYYMQSDTLFSAHLLIELIEYLGYHKGRNVIGYYHRWVIIQYEKINWDSCFEKLRQA